ncbi:MAG TPA: S1 RNA-binding domain-containing protein, partial [Acidimicrobiales bacterium]|nr:S1 RNA-binding domain-containing protein [Acidimicrobiales bacterium]
HQVGQLVYGRITKLVPFGAFVQVGDGIEGLVHISEMAAHHVDLPEQVVSPGEELWVKIIEIDLERRRISLSIKQAAEGGEVAEEYREAFGEHAYDDEGNYIGAYDYSSVEFTPETEAQAAWADFAEAKGATVKPLETPTDVEEPAPPPASVEAEAAEVVAESTDAEAAEVVAESTDAEASGVVAESTDAEAAGVVAESTDAEEAVDESTAD